MARRAWKQGLKGGTYHIPISSEYPSDFSHQILENFKFDIYIVLQATSHMVMFFAIQVKLFSKVTVFGIIYFFLY